MAGSERLLPAGNAQPAFAYYRSQRDAREWRPFAIQVLTLSEDAVAAVTNFVNPALFVPFGLPLVLPFDPREAGRRPMTFGADAGLDG